MTRHGVATIAAAVLTSLALIAAFAAGGSEDKSPIFGVDISVGYPQSGQTAEMATQQGEVT